MLKFMSLSSGSCGNCYYLGTGDDGLLIDAGVSLKSLKRILEENSLSDASFSAILVTHDHLDHIRHLGSFCKRLHKPVYTTAVLRTALLRHTFTAAWFGNCSRVLEEGIWNDIGVASVKYFEVPHDATQTVGYGIDIRSIRCNCNSAQVLICLYISKKVPIPIKLEYFRVLFMSTYGVSVIEDV